MPIYSTNKIPDYGTIGGGLITDFLEIDLNRSNSNSDLVDVTINLTYTGVTYGGQTKVFGTVVFTAFRDNVNIGHVAVSDFPATPDQTVSVSKTVQLPKDLGKITIQNCLSVYPYARIDIERNKSEALFVVAFR